MQSICLRLFVSNVINKTPVRNTPVSRARRLAATNPHLAPQPASASPSVFLLCGRLSGFLSPSAPTNPVTPTHNRRPQR